MPIQLAAHTFFEGTDSVPYLNAAIRIAPWLFVIGLLKIYFGGARNTAERNMHSKVVMITGGTAGIGAATARELASRGAQLVLLTQQPLSDPFLAEYIYDLRKATDNQLITAEQVDLSSLHSIRTFATKWIDNAPPRRLDMVILCANTQAIRGAPLTVSEDGVESIHAVNYLGNFHLLSILSPALRAQPPHRDVRIIVCTCSSYIGAPPDALDKPTIPRPNMESVQRRKLVATNPAAAYATSKLALMTFASSFQAHLDAYKRPDNAPNNARVIMVDPRWSRTPGMRRYLSGGSLWGLAFYLATWPLWWLVLKSPIQGAQTILWAAMEQEFERGAGGRFLKECKDADFMRKEIKNVETQRKLWQVSEKAIEALEKEGAVRRANAKKAEKRQESEAKKREEKAKVKEKEKEVGSRRSRKNEKS